MPDPLSLNVQHLKASETVAISNEAKRRKAAGEDVLDLGVGEPDFDTPVPAAQAGVQAVQRGMTRYPPNVGIAELRRAIAQQLSQLSGGRPVDPDRLVVSSGSKQSIFNACFTLFGPTDRVLIPAPAWVSYPQIVHLCRAEPVLVPGDVEWGLKVSVKDLDRQSNRMTRGLILCSPCNPTGAVYTLPELKAIAEWAKKNEIWVISDEIYRRIHFGPGPAASLLDLPDDLLERTVIIYGASKAYAMTGWRIGAAWAPPHLTKAMAALQSHTTTGANHPAQWAAATAFTDERVEAEVVRMVAAFRHRRDYLVGRFRAELPGIEFVEPHGAFYFFFRVDGIREKDPVTGQAFCEQLMKQEGVALVPGGAFADDRWVRLSYAVSDSELEQALDRIVRFVQRLASARAA
jgi:aspartate aminotransferase